MGEKKERKRGKKEREREKKRRIKLIPVTVPHGVKPPKEKEIPTSFSCLTMLRGVVENK